MPLASISARTRWTASARPSELVNRSRSVLTRPPCRCLPGDRGCAGGRAIPGRHDLRTVNPVSWDDTTLARPWFSPPVPDGPPLERNTGPVAAASVGHGDVAEPAVPVAAAGEDTGSEIGRAHV